MSRTQYNRDQQELDRFSIINGATAVNTTSMDNYGYVVFDANDSAPDYIGLNIDVDANTSDDDWIVFKFTYSGSDVTSIKRKIGVWDNRTSLF